MKMKLNQKHTIIACCTSYITQAVVVNFAPLLFVQFGKQFDISLSEISLLITICFGVELAVDLLTAKYSDKFSQRSLIISALIIAMLGIGGFAIFPFWFKNPYWGLVISNVFCGIGGGLMEVLISPIIEACPAENKSGNMSLLHSFYCWGQASVIIITTLFILFAGIENWRIIALLWTVAPLIALVMFIFVPIYGDPSKLPPEARKEKAQRTSIGSLLKNPVFLLFFGIMVCSGASELAMSQWSSSFAESGLGISKALGDIFGPCLFGILMGMARILYSKFSDHLNPTVCMLVSSVLCALSYLVAALSPIRLISLLGCSLCGFSVGILWPCALSLAAERINGSVTLFALLAVGGDLGCLIGPAATGAVADAFGGNIAASFIFALIFPVALIIFISVLNKGKKARKRS